MKLELDGSIRADSHWIKVKSLLEKFTLGTTYRIKQYCIV